MTDGDQLFGRRFSSGILPMILRRYVSAMRRKYFLFFGRSRRREYWSFVSVYVVLSIIAIVIDEFLIGFRVNDQFGIVRLVLGLSHFSPSLALAVRRLHDIGRSGWWFLVVLIPIIGWIVFLYWVTRPSQEDTNVHGSRPD